jgi:hypothetical protein
VSAINPSVTPSIAPRTPSRRSCQLEGAVRAISVTAKNTRSETIAERRGIVRRRTQEEEDSSLLLEREEVVGRASEDAGEGEREREARHVPVVLDARRPCAR